MVSERQRRLLCPDRDRRRSRAGDREPAYRSAAYGWVLGLTIVLFQWIVYGIRLAIRRYRATPVLDLDAITDANVATLTELKAAMMAAHRISAAPARPSARRTGATLKRAARQPDGERLPARRGARHSNGAGAGDLGGAEPPTRCSSCRPQHRRDHRALLVGVARDRDGVATALVAEATTCRGRPSLEWPNAPIGLYGPKWKTGAK